MTEIVMRNGNDVQKYLLHADGSAVRSDGLRVKDFTDLFLIMRNLGYSFTESTLSFPARKGNSNSPVRKGKLRDRRMLRQFDGFRQEWAELEADNMASFAIS